MPYTYVSNPWTNATFSIYAAKGDNTQWLEVDNAALAARPRISVSGAECYYPGAALPIAPINPNTVEELPTMIAPQALPPALDVLPKGSDSESVNSAPTHESSPDGSGWMRHRPVGDFHRREVDGLTPVVHKPDTLEHK